MLRSLPRRGVTAAILAALLGAWLGPAAVRAESLRPSGASIDDLLKDVQAVPLGGRLPRSFALQALGGGRVTLGDLTGRAAFLYFWASW